MPDVQPPTGKPVTTGTGPGAVTDCHTGWDCTAGASLLAGITGPGRGTLPDFYGTIYVCPDHCAQAEARIITAGYQPDTEPAPPGHRWNPWPCGRITTYGTSGPQLALTLTSPVATAEQAPTPGTAAEAAPAHTVASAVERHSPVVCSAAETAIELGLIPEPAEHDHDLQEWRSAAYAHARRANDAEAVTRHTKELLQRRTATLRTRAERAEGTLDRVRGVRDAWAGYTLEPGQVRRLLDELTRALCDEPVPVVITQDAAAHVLAQEGLDGGYRPGGYIGRLLTAWWFADPQHAARLAAAYPVYGAAIALLRTPGGPEQLHRVATGQDTCSGVHLDGEPIRVFATGEMSDEDATGGQP